MSLGLSSYALSIPFVLTGVHGYAGVGYDDGVYMGVAVLFVHGTMPYRDYVLGNPLESSSWSPRSTHLAEYRYRARSPHSDAVRRSPDPTLGLEVPLQWLSNPTSGSAGRELRALRHPALQCRIRDQGSL